MSKKDKRAHAGPGRPTEYQEGYPLIAEELCREKGYTDLNLATHFGVGKTALYCWKNKYPEFAEVIKKGKDSFDNRVIEQSLLKRAQGYDYVETHRELRKNADGVEVLVVVKDVTKHIPSTDVSMIFWLKNRNPARWSDKKDIDHRVEDLRKPLSDDEQLKKLEDAKALGTGIDMRSIEGEAADG